MYAGRGASRARVCACVCVRSAWTASNLQAWRQTHFMHEKYSAVESGVGGGGGEYTPQVGFGWTNGVALALLARYGDALAA